MFTIQKVNVTFKHKTQTNYLKVKRKRKLRRNYVITYV